MPASNPSLSPISDTDANFRLWVAAISAALLACGLVKTSDTGQIDVVTVARPTGATTFMGYEIWRSNDGGSGLNNWYMKIEYGSGTAQNTPAIRVTFGWGSNGSGTLTGNLTSATTIRCNGSQAGALSTFFSGQNNSFIFSLFEGSNTYKFILSVERTRDKNGAELDELFIFSIGNNGSDAYMQVLPRTGTIPTGSTGATLPGSCLIATGLANYSSNFGVGTMRPLKGGFLMDSMNFFFGNSTDFASALMNYTIGVYGSNRNYIAATQILSSSFTSTRLLTRHE